VSISKEQFEQSFKDKSYVELEDLVHLAKLFEVREYDMDTSFIPIILMAIVRVMGKCTFAMPIKDLFIFPSFSVV
jgi:hypothetical protein